MPRSAGDRSLDLLARSGSIHGQRSGPTARVDRKPSRALWRSVTATGASARVDRRPRPTSATGSGPSARSGSPPRSPRASLSRRAGSAISTPRSAPMAIPAARRIPAWRRLGRRV